MCGFVACVGNTHFSPPAFRLATRWLAHRGPDDEAYYFSPSFAAGFRRLKILDLSNDARQPMADPTGRFILVFNGELYNYRELRSELLARGWVFRSQSDTEVLLTAYQAWGEDCLSRFNGMFAFLLWDSQEQRLFGARDRFGEKPLFYAERHGIYYFASEIKALFPLLGRVPEPHPGAIRRYLENKWTDHAEQTFFRGISTVPPATCFTVQQGRMSLRPYWRLETSRTEVGEDVITRFRELFFDAVRLRMRADVPVGTCLSGGLDSGSIVSSIPHVLGESGTHYSGKTFTATYPEYDESQLVAEVNQVAGTNGFTCVPTPSGLEALEELLWYHDEPFHSFAAYASFEVMRLARQEGVVVLLNGQGADETLAGYSKYLTRYLADLLRQGCLRVAWEAAQGGRELTQYSVWKALRQAVWVSFKQHDPRRKWGETASGQIRAGEQHGFTRDFLETAVREDAPPRLSPTIPESLLKTTLLYSIQVHNLPLYLRVEDRNSMAHSLESRLPFLDHRLVEYVFSLPTHWLMRGGSNKYLLREAMRGILPEQVRQRRDKFGFPIPEVRWLYGDLRPQIEDLLTSREFVERGQFDARRLLQEYRQEADAWQLGRKNLWEYRSRWFRLISVELWQRNMSQRYRLTKDEPSESTADKAINATILS